MKTLNIIMTIIGLSAIAMTAQAQKPVQEISQAFDEFSNKLYKGRYVTSSTHSEYKNGDYKTINFAMPGKKKDDVTNYDNVLFDNNKLAYSSFFKKANSGDKSTITIAYGENNSTKMEYGVHGDRNYNIQAIRDMKDSTMRYVYTLIWYSKKDSIFGNIEKIYGKDPRIKKTLKGAWKINDDGITGPGVSISDKGIELADGVDLDDVLKQLEELGDQYDDIDNDNNADGDVNNAESTSTGNVSTDASEIKSGENIVQKINGLQIVYSKLNNKYKDYTKCSGNKRLEMLNVRRLMIATNNQIRMLVNTGRLGKMLSDDDKNFIADQLNEMSNESKDKWLKKSLLDLSTSLVKD